MRACFFVCLAVFQLLGCATNPTQNDKNVIISPHKAEKDYYILASQLHSFQKDYKGARDLLHIAQKKFPNDPDIGLYLSYFESVLGNLKTAAEGYASLISQYPSSEPVLSSSAEFFAGTNKKDLALSLYRILRHKDKKSAKYWILGGLLEVELGKVEEAKKSFLHVIKNFSKDVDQGYYYLGKLHKFNSEFKLAKRAFEDCLKVNPSSEDCAIERTESLWVFGQKERAYRGLAQFTKKNPRAPRALATLVDLYLSQGELKLALKGMEKLERLDPSNKDVRRKLSYIMVQVGDFAGAEERFSYLARGRSAEHSDIVRYADLLKASESYNEALVQLRRIPAKSEMFSKSLFMKYGLLKKIHGNEICHEIVKKEAKELKGKNPEANIILAQSFVETSDLASARVTLEKSLKKNINHIQSLYMLGQILYRVGDKDQGIDRMEKVISLDDQHSDAMNFIAYDLADRGGSLERAENLINSALSIKADDGHYRDTHGWILYKQERYEESREALELAVHYLPDEAIVLEHLADVYTSLELHEKALKTYLLALSLYKGQNRNRVGGKIARIQSSRGISSVGGAD